MIIRNKARGYLVVAGLAAAMGLGASALPAAAQDYGSDSAYAPDDVVGGITVYAPPYQRRDSSGATIETLRASRVVYFRDLDPSTAWGSHVLKIRIERAARDACDDIDAKAPFAVTTNDSDASCVARAVDRAMYRVARMTDASYGNWDDR